MKFISLRLCSCITFLLMLAVAVNCTQSKFESDQQAQKPAQQDNKDPEHGLPRDDGTSPCDRTLNAVTKARLLTDKIVNRKPKQWLSYELSVTDCDGKLRHFSGRIFFDLDATVTPFIVDFPYQIIDPQTGSLLHNGVFNHKLGQDLFGNSGEIFGYHEAVDWKMTSDRSVIILNIAIDGLTIAPRIGDASAPLFTVPSYLKVGASAPVKADLAVSSY
jgi:hypothetical protein